MGERRTARMAEPDPVPTFFVEGAVIERGEDFVRLVFWTCLETVEFAPPEQRIVIRAAMTPNSARRFQRNLQKALAGGGH